MAMCRMKHMIPVQLAFGIAFQNVRAEGGHDSPVASTSLPPTPHEVAQATRLEDNHEAMTYYAAALTAAIALVALFRFGKLIKRIFPSFLTVVFSPLVWISRISKKVFLRTCPGVGSVGRLLVVSAYFALNVVFLFVHIDFDAKPMRSVIGARAGWLGISNLCFTVFLSLRNTPLSFLIAHSYERLKFLHGISGIMALLQTIIHGSCYTVSNAQRGTLSNMITLSTVSGIVAGFMFLGMVFVAIVVRRKSYAVFYVLHVLFFILLLIFMGLHKPNYTKRAIIAIGLAAGLWVVDHFLRLARTLSSLNNTATVFPLTNGGTRVTLKKALWTAAPGKHAYLWIPRIRAFETHPFTITQKEPMQFVVAARNGFTRDLYNYAVANPGASLRACVQGPYGRIPDAASYDKLVLIAGSGGASFTTGVAMDLIHRFKKPDMTFIWAVKKLDSFFWFARKVRRLSQQSNVSVRLFVTNETFRTPGSDLSDGKGTGEDIYATGSEFDIEAFPRKERSFAKSLGLPITCGRPDVPSLIRDEIGKATAAERVLVIACGPPGLMREVKNTTASCIKIGGPDIDLHCEQFGW